MNNNQPNYYGHHISSINLSFIELESASQQVRLAQAKSGSSVRVRGCLAIWGFYGRYLFWWSSLWFDRLHNCND